jgi:signal transduction histidine kinase
MTPFKNRLNGYFSDNDAMIEKCFIVDLYHDINNSACIISGYVEIMQSREITLDNQIKYLEKIQHESYQINKLLNGYLKPIIKKEWTL